MYSSAAHKRVALKQAPEVRLRREKETLQQFEGDAYIRQLIDYGKESPFLVLEHLDSDALRWSRKSPISRHDLKLVAHSILSALGSLHAKGIAHTGQQVSTRVNMIVLTVHVKMSNRTTFSSTSTQVVREFWKLDWLIVVSPSTPSTCREVSLTSLLSGDACDVGFETNSRGTAHAIGAAIFRSPGALLGLKWSTATDIWSFGATASTCGQSHYDPALLMIS